MIKSLCWNIREIRSKGTMPYLNILMSKYKADLLVLLKPPICSGQIEKFQYNIKFDVAAQ